MIRILFALIGVSLLFADAARARGLPDIVINEVRIDQPGADIDEFFELKGPPGEPLTELAYVVIGDGPSALGSGVVEAVIDLTGHVIPADGHFLVTEASFSLPGVADLVITLPFENSDNVTHVLVFAFTGSVGDDLDFNDDGVLDVIPWFIELDRIALLEEPNPPAGTELHYGPPSIGPDCIFVPGHIYRCETSGAWVMGPFDRAGGEDTPGIANLPCQTQAVFNGLLNVAIGQAVLDDNDCNLIVCNIGSSGEDGVRQELGERARGFGFVTFVDEAGNLPSGLKIWSDLYVANPPPGVAGQDQKASCVFLSETNGGDAAIGFDTTLLQPAQVRLDFRLQGDLIQSVLYDPPYPTHFIQGPIGSTTDGETISFALTNLQPLTPPTSWFDVRFPVTPVVPFGRVDPVTVDWVRFVLIDAATMPDVGHAEVRATIPVGAYCLNIARESLGLFGNAYSGLGQAEMTTDENGHLVISNIGSSGEDGVSIEPGSNDDGTWTRVEFFRVLTEESTDPAGHISLSTSGVNEKEPIMPIGEFHAMNVPNNGMHVELLADFAPIGAFQHTVHVFLAGAMVAQVVGNDLPVMLNDGDVDIGVISEFGAHAEGQFDCMLASPQMVSIPGGPTVLGDEVHFVAEVPGGVAAITGLRRIELLAANVGGIEILESTSVFPPSPCPSDLTGEGDVNAADLATLLGVWGACAGCVEDLTGDNVVNAADLAILLGAWGPCR